MWPLSLFGHATGAPSAVLCRPQSSRSHVAFYHETLPLKARIVTAKWQQRATTTRENRRRLSSPLFAQSLPQPLLPEQIRCGVSLGGGTSARPSCLPSFPPIIGGIAQACLFFLAFGYIFLPLPLFRLSSVFSSGSSLSVLYVSSS